LVRGLERDFEIVDASHEPPFLSRGLDCGSALALFDGHGASECGRALPQSRRWRATGGVHPSCGGLLLGLLCLALCSLRAAAAIPGVEHVVVIGVDGLNPNGIRVADTPNFDKLIKGGAHTFHARAVMPTSSSPNWASMIMGAGPEQHGVTFDEVVTGFRLALGGAQEYYGVIPDLVAYGKALGGGFPLGAYAGCAELMDVVAEHRLPGPH
jgi:hypothetical protein